MDARRRKKEVIILHPEILRLNFGDGGNKNQFHKAGEKYVIDFMSCFSSLKRYFADGGDSRNSKISFFLLSGFELKTRDFFLVCLQCFKTFFR